LSGHGGAFGINGDVSHADDSDLSVGVIGLRTHVLELGCENIRGMIWEKETGSPLCVGAKHG